MRMYDLIKKKRDGGVLSTEEIRFMIEGYTKGEIPDYQMAAMMMAIFLKNMDPEETVDLTMAMAESGDMLDLSGIKGPKVDKHSTGGVGDKTSLALLPMVSACGVKVAKMSGRGLGHTGGTIDKLESIPGFSTEIPEELFFKNVSEIGMSIMGQTADLAPADKKLYALRDVTATVDKIPLIASSIMSKKLAAGADAIVLDVKTGSGAFMRRHRDARALAWQMVLIGNMAGRLTVAAITDMDQPLGYAIGNALEVREAIETLQGKGPKDFTELCLTLGSLMLVAGGLCEEESEARGKLEESINNGKALEQLIRFVKAQGGDPEAIRHPDRLPRAKRLVELRAEESGYIRKLVCDEIGICSMMLGGGREKKEDVIDPAVGILLKKKVGDRVEAGDVIAVLHVNDEKNLEEVKKRFLNAVEISANRPKARPFIHEIVK